MSAYEVRLAVPDAARDGLPRELSSGQVTTVPLHAICFDTPGSALSRRHVSLRVRREGHDRVQTLTRRAGAREAKACRKAVERLADTHPFWR
jgi:inorganic triphosphatase YgiF